jgi:hypothetical protein
VLLKIVTLFLVGMVAVAVLGKLRLGAKPGAKPGARLKSPVKCPDCGRFLIGKGPCDCKSKPKG